MPRRIHIVPLLSFLVPLCTAWTALAEEPAAPALTQAQTQTVAAQVPRGATVAPRPPVFFRETWNLTTRPYVSMTEEFIENADLELKLYGPGTYSPGRDRETTVNINLRPEPDNVDFIWTGMAAGNWAITLRHKNSYVDLSGPLTKIRWRSSQNGFQFLRPVLRLEDGTYVVGDKGVGASADWQQTEFVVADIRWAGFDPVNAIDDGTGWRDPDLTRVDEIGFTTLSPGGGHAPGVAARMDWIEVYGYPVSRGSRTRTR